MVYTSTRCLVHNVTHYLHSLVPRLLRVFQCYMQKERGSLVYNCICLMCTRTPNNPTFSKRGDCHFLKFQSSSYSASQHSPVNGDFWKQWYVDLIFTLPLPFPYFVQSRASHMQLDTRPSSSLFSVQHSKAGRSLGTRIPFALLWMLREYYY